jgi:hypothetical protein
LKRQETSDDVQAKRAPPMIGVDDIDDSLDSAASSLSIDANDKNIQQSEKPSTEALRIKSAPSSGAASSLFSPRPVIVNSKKDICNTIALTLIFFFFFFFVFSDQ